MEFRGPSSTPSAVGASLALDKVCAALSNMEEQVSHAHTHASPDVPDYCNKSAADTSFIFNDASLQRGGGATLPLLEPC